MKIEISVGEDTLIPNEGELEWFTPDVEFFHYAYCDNIDEAIEILNNLKKLEDN